ncbi:MAG: hypothetical protein R3E02_03885 [Blastomonas sp.]
MTMHFAPHSFYDRIAGRGFVPLYHLGEVNHCPGCNGTHWHVGRTSAECASCETAVALADVAAQPMAPLFHTTRSRSADRAFEKVN